MHGVVTIGTAAGVAEIEVAAGICAAGSAREPAEAKRAVLNAYGLVRLTSRADDYLGLAVGLADPNPTPR